MRRVHVRFVSDIICPWSYIHKRRFDVAAQGFERAMMVPVETTWEPFQFRQDIPPEGQDLVEAIRDWYGSDAASMFGDVEKNPIYSLGREEGIEFNPERRVVSTALAHRLVKWVGDRGGKPAQHDLMEHLFHHYHELAADISEVPVLAQIATEAGLDADEVSAMLASPLHVDWLEANAVTPNSYSASRANLGSGRPTGSWRSTRGALASSLVARPLLF